MGDCPGCARFLCDDCTPTRNAPYFARMTRREIPEGWPLKGFKERRGAKLVTVSAHDLIIKMLKDALKTERAEYLRNRSPEVAEQEEFLRQSALF